MDASFSAWRSLTTLGEVLPMCHMGKHKGTIRPHLGEVHAKNDHIAVGVAGCDETYCWWLSSCTSWYVVYHSLSHCLQGFIHPRWCRISSINSMSRFFLHPGPAAGWTRTLFSGSWFRSPFFSRFFTPFFFLWFFGFLIWFHLFFETIGFWWFPLSVRGPTVGFLQTRQLQDLSMLVWGNKLESDYQCGGPGWTRKETHQELHGICCIFTVPRIPRPPILHRKM